MRIVGFGACMINGFPYDVEVSFFSQLINQLKLENYNIEFSETVSLGGFPINRAKKYLNRKVISFNPDIVVLQFGTTDVKIDISSSLMKIFNIKKASTNISSSDVRENIKRSLQYNSITYFFRYLIKNLLIKLFSIKPATSIEIYISSIEDIINTLNQNNIKVVILAPFIQTDPFANIRINKYTKKVKELRKKYDFCFVDCSSELKKYKKDDVLLHDGLHLTPKGHSIIAKKLSIILKNELLN